FGAIEGRMLVRLGAVEQAVPVLEAVPPWGGGRGPPAFQGGAGGGAGGAPLLPRRGPAPAPAPPPRPGAGRRRAPRPPAPPAAAVFLAEAEWQAEDEDAHDAAAEAAYAAAEASGTLRPLSQALGLVPGVLARRLDAEGPGERRWHALVQAEPGAGAAPPDGARLRIHTLGQAAMELDGPPLPVTLTKAVAVAAWVARAGPPGTT